MQGVRNSDKKPGRPARDGDGLTSEFVIDKTCELILSNPPAKITRVLVAKSCGIHPSLIHYYFKSRASLMAAAATRLSKQFRSEIQTRMKVADATPTERLRTRISALVDLEMKYPYFHRLIIEEIIGSPEPMAIDLVHDLTHYGMDEYRAIIRDGVEAGEFRDVDGGWIFTSAIGLCHFFDKARQFYAAFNEPPLSADDLKEAYRGFLIDFMMNAVIKR